MSGILSVFILKEEQKMIISIFARIYFSKFQKAFHIERKIEPLGSQDGRTLFYDGQVTGVSFIYRRKAKMPTFDIIPEVFTNM